MCYYHFYHHCHYYNYCHCCLNSIFHNTPMLTSLYPQISLDICWSTFSSIIRYCICTRTARHNTVLRLCKWESNNFTVGYMERDRNQSFVGTQKPRPALPIEANLFILYFQCHACIKKMLYAIWWLTVPFTVASCQSVSRQGAWRTVSDYISLCKTCSCTVAKIAKSANLRKYHGIVKRRAKTFQKVVVNPRLSHFPEPSQSSALRCVTTLLKRGSGELKSR